VPPPPPALRPALHVETSGDGPPLVLAHGFTQTGRLWGPFGQALLGHHQLIRVDLPGHGGSSDVQADLPVGGALLAAVADGDPFDLLGYSLGARFALHAALERPDRVHRLVLIGATAGIEDPAARERRRERDEAMADELERSGDLVGFLERWLANPLFAGVRAPEVGERRRNTPAGLASSLRLAGTGTQQPLWDVLPRLEMPVLVLAGAADLRFATLGQRLVRALPDGVLSLVPGAGHAAHLEQPTSTARLVTHFLGAG
jgi:2-succinyl-6-hydroxy-2,4-cyclohexadiene-1-carboxylate synthase